MALSSKRIPILHIIITIIVVPTAITILLLTIPGVPRSVSLVTWLKSSVGHDICTLSHEIGNGLFCICHHVGIIGLIIRQILFKNILITETGF